jgi:hypothetical protein
MNEGPKRGQVKPFTDIRLGCSARPASDTKGGYRPFAAGAPYSCQDKES